MGHFSTLNSCVKSHFTILGMTNITELYGPCTINSLLVLCVPQQVYSPTFSQRCVSYSIQSHSNLPFIQILLPIMRCHVLIFIHNINQQWRKSDNLCQKASRKKWYCNIVNGFKQSVEIPIQLNFTVCQSINSLLFL